MSAEPNASRDTDRTLRATPLSDAATQTPLADSAGTGSTASSNASNFSIPEQDLSGENLLAGAPLVHFGGRSVPSLGGIPLLAKLGQGGMGAVYFGVKPLLKQEVAVKVLPKQLALQHAGLVDRFLREAQIAARVESPHLVRVTDVGEQGGLHYLVMEFVRGESGAGYLKRLAKAGQRVPVADALALCLAAAEGLCAAHGDGVIHRDVKPDNILLPFKKNSQLPDFSAAKLADLGLARGEDLSQQSLTGADATMGTPGYMAPEQALNARKAGKPADVFSFGATLYALLAGKPPFRGETATETVMLTLQQPNVPLQNLRPDVSPRTASVVERCLAKDPAQRFADAFELKAALQACGVGTGNPALAEPRSGLASSSTFIPSGAEKTPAAPAKSSAWGLRILGAAALLALTAAIFFTAFTNKADIPAAKADTGAAPPAATLPAPPPSLPASSELAILTCFDKVGWMQWAAGEFQKTPEAEGLQLRVSALDSESAREGLLTGTLKPQVWSPASEMLGELFKTQWRHSASPYSGSGVSLAGSPLVCVLLEDRHAVLQKKYQDASTRTLIRAIVEGRWSKIEGPDEWGAVRFALPSMAEPESALFWGTQAGLQFHEGGIRADKIRSPEIRPWYDALKRCTTLPASTRAGAESFILQGAAVGDGVALFESALLQTLEKNASHAKIKVVYARMNFWNDHPYLPLDAPWNSPAQRKAAEAFQLFLLSEPVQRKLLDWGLRPALSKISLRDETSPWMRHQKLGVSLDIGIRNKQPNVGLQKALLDLLR